MHGEVRLGLERAAHSLQCARGATLNVSTGVGIRPCHGVGLHPALLCSLPYFNHTKIVGIHYLRCHCNVTYLRWNWSPYLWLWAAIKCGGCLLKVICRSHWCGGEGDTGVLLCFFSSSFPSLLRCVWRYFNLICSFHLRLGVKICLVCSIVLSTWSHAVKLKVTGFLFSSGELQSCDILTWFWNCQAIMCWETSSELMTWQHVILILSETNVPMVVTSSILGFKGCYQFMLVSALRFLFFPTVFYQMFDKYFLLCASLEMQIFQHQKPCK